MRKKEIVSNFFKKVLDFCFGLWYTMSIESERRKIMKDKKETVVMSEARRKAKRDIAHLTKLGILKKVKESA